MALPGENSAPSRMIARRNLPLCILDEDANASDLLITRLALAGFPATGTTAPEQALAAIRNGNCRAVIANRDASGASQLQFLDLALATDPGVYVILVSGGYSLDLAVEAIRHGAYDFFGKPIDQTRLMKSLDELAEVFTVRTQIRELEEQLLPRLEFHGIIGKSPAMLEVFDLARKVAKHYTTALVTGPTGSGKELIARAIHEMSPVKNARFAICNCSALVDTLLESQLFGHVRGAFTGATETRPGLFEYASGGTAFLDEVGEMSLGMQAKLLRVIQNREIQRVGSPEVRQVEIRVIAATNRDLREEVSAGRFREDLFYRLSTVEIRVPGLEERIEDIPLLVRHFLKKYSEAYHKNLRGLTRRAQIALLRRPWRGNVRELENVISSAAIVATEEFIDLADFPAHVQKRALQAGPGQNDWGMISLAELRQKHIERVLEACKGNRVRASHILGIGRTSLYRYLRRSHRVEKAATSANS